MAKKGKSKQGNTNGNRHGGGQAKGTSFTAPLASTTLLKSTTLRHSMSANGDHRLSRRVYIGDVQAPPAGDDFSIHVEKINPGNENLFPFLSKIAALYERYRFHKLRFLYRPTCPTTTQGTVILAVDYEPFDETPHSKMELMGLQDSARCVKWGSCGVSADCSKRASLEDLYIRGSNDPVGADARLYDLGSALWAIESSENTEVSCGEIFVEYDVSLLKPHYNLQDLNLDSYAVFETTDLDGVGTPDFTNATKSGSDKINITQDGSDQVLDMPPGLYRVDLIRNMVGNRLTNDFISSTKPTEVEEDIEVMVLDENSVFDASGGRTMRQKSYFLDNTKQSLYDWGSSVANKAAQRFVASLIVNFAACMSTLTIGAASIAITRISSAAAMQLLQRPGVYENLQLRSMLHQDPELIHGPKKIVQK